MNYCCGKPLRRGNWACFGNLAQGAGGDPDGDGYTNLQEYTWETNPTVANNYVILSTGSLTNHLFPGDSTTLVLGDVQLHGETVIEGGAVIRMARADWTNNTPRLRVMGTLDCQTDMDRPAIVTAMDDSLVERRSQTFLPNVLSRPLSFRRHA